MKSWKIVLAFALLTCIASSSLEAQRGRGNGNRGGGPPPVETVAQVSKALLAKIKLDKPQDESMKALTKKFTAEEKEILRLASMVRGGGARGANGPQTTTTLEALNERYLTSARALLSEPQRLKADSNMVAFAKKQMEAQMRASRGRSGG
jgi:hypothetical protein